MKTFNLNQLKTILAAVLLTFGLNGWGTDYVFVYNNNNYLGVNGTSISNITSLSENCIWHCTSNTNNNPTAASLSTNNNQLRYLYIVVNGTKYWLQGSTTNGSSVSTSTSGAQNWMTDNSNHLIYRSGNNSYYVYYRDNAWKNSSQAGSQNNYGTNRYSGRNGSPDYRCTTQIVFRADVSVGISTGLAGSVGGTVSISGTTAAGTYGTTASLSQYSAGSAQSKTFYLFAQPATGYEFVGWTTSSNGTTAGSVTSPVTVSTASTAGTITATTYYAIFRKSETKATVNVGISSKSGTQDGTVSVSASSTEPGNLQTLTQTENSASKVDKTFYLWASPSATATANHYVLAGWTEAQDGENVSLSADQPRPVIVQTGNNVVRNYYAIFKQLVHYQFSVSVDPTLEGEISAIGGTATASVDKTDVWATSLSQLSETATATFSATANPGYAFIGWTKTLGKTSPDVDENGNAMRSNPYTPTVTNTAGGLLSLHLYAIFSSTNDPISAEITPTSADIDKGETQQIDITFTPEGCYKDYTFESSNTNVATVNGAGLVTGVKQGTANITVKVYRYDKTVFKTETVTVNVWDKLPMPSITIVQNTTDRSTATATIVKGAGTPEEAVIHYTTDGSDPTETSPVYTTALTTIENEMTVKAIVTCAKWYTSDIAEKTFTMQKTSKPIINIDGNNVTFTSNPEDPDVIYYYTYDGTTPTVNNGIQWTESKGAITDLPTNVTIKVIAKKEGYGPSDVVSAKYDRVKLPTPEIQIVGDRVWFLCGEPGVTFYYTTNGTTPTTSSSSSDGSEITGIAANSNIKVIAVKEGYVTSDPAEKTKGTANVVYLDFTNGNDNNDGSSTTKAKKTWAGAYKLLGFGPNAKYLKQQWADHNLTTLSGHSCFNNVTDFSNTVDNNVIYLVGDVSSSNFNDLNKTPDNANSETNYINPVLEAGFFKPVTISGKYATSHTYSDGSHYAQITMTENKHYLNEDTRFEYVQFYGAGNGGSTDFILNYYDIEMGKGITNANFTSTKEFSTYHHGYRQKVTNTPHLQFYGGLSRDRRFGNGTNAELNFDYYLPHPDGYKITLRSGYFSTISPGSTQWSTDGLNGTMGSPNTPVKCIITVDIDRAWNDDHKNVLKNQSSLGDPDCDVAVVIAGVHEGNIYGDMDIIVKSGRIYRVVNGTFGANYFVTNHPADSYFGRANILIDPREPSAEELGKGIKDKNSLVVINELYGGGLGRFKSDSNRDNQSSTYFYGKSTVTINGGTFLSAIYASGAGGINGIGDDAHHTQDKYLPYMNGSNIAYGPYDSWKAGSKLYVTCRNSDGTTEKVDLAETNTKIEIHGGVFGSSTAPIEGIFGGGYGYVDVELIDYNNTYWNRGVCKPNTQAGSIFAAQGKLASSVLIDGNTVIYGNIYGAGRGDNRYYNYSGLGSSYNALGIISGNTELTIGGKVKVHGSVYGAGQGFDNTNLTNMARLYGNSTVTIKDYAQVTGGIYGGGQNGSMDGNLSLSIIDDAIIGTATENANVHGGGYGQITNINGNVDVRIGEEANDNPIFHGDVYGGSALGKVNASTSNTTTVTLNHGTVNGSIYGGGLGNSTTAADVKGNVQVNVYGGTVTRKTGEIGSGSVFGGNNINGSPQGMVMVDVYGTDPALSEGEYALYAVYGGGNMSDYSGTPVVTVHNCDNSIEYVYGGGNASEVSGTDVTIWGGNVIGNVFGGGNGSSEGWPTGQTNPGANINGAASVKINGGTILNVFGGSNTLGTISGGTSVVVNAQQEPGAKACTMLASNVYGAGNEAPYSGNTSVQILNGTVRNVFGGGKGATALVTGNTNVKVGDNVTGHAVNVLGNVCGGGDQANLTGNANVSVENCATTIAGDVYGGGNLSNVANASVTVYGGNIGNVYGGGKGSETISSDIGTASVHGNATTNIYGGTFGGIFGAGNIQSDITGKATLWIDENTYPDHASCEFGTAKEIYGAGNHAAITGEIDMGVGCISGKIMELYGGAKQADINSDIVLNIKGGRYGKIFGGNNLGGDINGTVTVNVQHLLCDVIEIDTLYGGGNLATYTAPSATPDYPLINLKACGLTTVDWENDGKHCMKIGAIFGGGKGGDKADPSRGKIVGNPHVNANAGEIGTIYGGGNEADVEGDTYVDIIDLHNTAGDNDNQDIYVTGNVYGGGNKASIKGNTHVQIGPRK